MSSGVLRVPRSPAAASPPLPLACLRLQAVTRKVRVLDVSYNASNNELVSSGGAEDCFAVGVLLLLCGV